MSRNDNKAVIWDMDGVIVDTALSHFSSWQNVFKKMGVKYTEEDFRRNFGQRNDTIIRNILGKDIPQSELNAISRDKERDAREKMKQNIKPLPGVIELMKSLIEHGFKIALVSSSPPENIKLVTEGLGIKNWFHSIISGEDVAEGKPSPQGFLLAARRLGVKPENCVVIEDAVAGVTAAKRAGMRCLAVTNTHSRTSLAEADLVVETLEAVIASDFEKLLASHKVKEIKMERTLVLVKPDAMQRKLIGAIIARLEGQGLKLVALKMLHMDKAMAQQHYAVHRGKPFFDGLVEYISSAPIVAAVFEGEKAVERARKLMGATDPAKSEKGTIRGDLGLDIEHNTIHGSDSVKTAEEEIKLFFAENEIFTY